MCTFVFGSFSQNSFLKLKTKRETKKQFLREILDSKQIQGPVNRKYNLSRLMNFSTRYIY